MCTCRHALTENDEGEIWGGPGVVLVDVLTGKDRLVVGVLGDGVSELHTGVGRLGINFGQLLLAVAARYRQGDLGFLNCSAWFIDGASEGEVISRAKGLVGATVGLDGNVVQSCQREKQAANGRKKECKDVWKVHH